MDLYVEPRTARDRRRMAPMVFSCSSRRRFGSTAEERGITVTMLPDPHPAFGHPLPKGEGPQLRITSQAGALSHRERVAEGRVRVWDASNGHDWKFVQTPRNQSIRLHGK